MRAVVITSNSPRHLYFIEQISQNLELCGVVIEPKKNYFLKQIESSVLISTHFKKLTDLENDKFAFEMKSHKKDYTLLETLDVNNQLVMEWVNKLKPDIILLFGCGILNANWFEIFKNKILNLHLGYSPRYRGSATLFWPYYNDEPEFIGTTVHIADQKIDHGPILEITKLEKIEKIDYYQTTLSIIKSSIDNFPIVTKKYLNQQLIPRAQNTNDQKYFYKKSDFNETVLRKVLEKYEK